MDMKMEGVETIRSDILDNGSQPISMLSTVKFSATTHNFNEVFEGEKTGGSAAYYREIL